MIKKATTVALVAAGILAAAGCSSSNDGDATKGGGPQQAPTDAVLKVARAYQEAANRLDWRTACKLSSAALRGGSIEKCAARNTPDDARAKPEQSTSPSPSFSPPTYADGSTPEPIHSSTPSGPDRADMGRVSASDVVEVPAAEEHPAGYGVLVSFTVQWPGKAAVTDRRALRLVKEGGAWVVDQHEDIQEGDEGHGSPVRTALSGG